jgi:hypothetical protein
MQKIETLGGSLVWIAVAVIMAFAALEPVELGKDGGPAAYAAADCGNGCETRRG